MKIYWFNQYMSRDNYPKALVPEHLVKTEISRLPLETAFYLDPSDSHDSDDYEPPVFFVMSDGELRTRLSAEVDRSEAYPGSPMGLIGIMRVAVIDGDNLIEGLIADLRFIEDGQLTAVDDEPPEDQEEFNYWLAVNADTKTIDAFIAPEEGATINNRGLIGGDFYGPELFYDALDVMRKRGNKILKAYQKREKKQAEKPEIKKTVADSSETKPEEKKAANRSSLTVSFVPPGTQSS